MKFVLFISFVNEGSFVFFFFFFQRLLFWTTTRHFHTSAKADKMRSLTLLTDRSTLTRVTGSRRMLLKSDSRSSRARTAMFSLSTSEATLYAILPMKCRRSKQSFCAKSDAHERLESPSTSTASWISVVASRNPPFMTFVISSRSTSGRQNFITSITLTKPLDLTEFFT